jgi:hypothetical protein
MTRSIKEDPYWICFEIIYDRGRSSLLFPPMRQPQGKDGGHGGDHGGLAVRDSEVAALFV